MSYTEADSLISMPTQFKTHLTARLYQVEVSKKQFLAIMDSDNRRLDKDYDDCYGLSGDLDALSGVDNTDYNGHFGANIYLRIEAEDDTADTWQKIYALINQAIE